MLSEQENAGFSIELYNDTIIPQVLILRRGQSPEYPVNWARTMVLATLLDYKTR